MKRDAYKYLLRWKESKDRQPLLMLGARQVGKTYLLKEFGSKEFKNLWYINFEETPLIKSFFEFDLRPERILQELSIHFGQQLDPANTLLVFDEIQECPQALSSLKYFCEHDHKYFVAAAGSLLGVKMSGAQGFPVGKVHFYHLFPMSFFEFLNAIGKSMLRQMLENIPFCEPIAEAHHQELIELQKLYFFIGGMPKCIARYIQTKDFQIVRETQEDILKAYVYDFAKHAPPQIVVKITQIWDSIPVHLGKENKKFVFAAIRKSARARDYEEALQWLIDASLIYKVTQIFAPKIPLKSYGNHEAFKVYLLDVGLLAAMCRIPAHVLINGDAFFIEFKGSFTENYIAQSLKTAFDLPLFYWSSEREAEVDFLIEREGKVCPIEVKSRMSTKAKSLQVYRDKYHPSQLFRASLMNLKKDGDVCNYPLYLASRMGDILEPV